MARQGFCAPYPEPLTSVILVLGRDIAASVAEVRVAVKKTGRWV